MLLFSFPILCCCNVWEEDLFEDEKKSSSFNRIHIQNSNIFGGAEENAHLHNTTSSQKLEKNVMNETFSPLKVLISYAPQHECLQKPLNIVLKQVAACYKTKQFKLTLISPNWIIVMITIAAQSGVHYANAAHHHNNYYHVFARNR